jgi:hypothetical protein
MTKTFERVEIGGMERINTDPDIYVADVRFIFREEIDGEIYGMAVDVRVRIKQSSSDTVQSLEQKIFAEARDLLVQTGQHIAGETSESLFAMVRRKERLAAGE